MSAGETSMAVGMPGLGLLLNPRYREEVAPAGLELSSILGAAGAAKKGISSLKGGGIRGSVSRARDAAAQQADEGISLQKILKAGDVEYEFRTTVSPEIVTEKDIEGIGEMVKGAKKLVLQQFISKDTLDKRYKTINPYKPEKLHEFANTLKKYSNKVILRL